MSKAAEEESVPALRERLISVSVFILSRPLVDWMVPANTEG